MVKASENEIRKVYRVLKCEVISRESKREAIDEMRESRIVFNQMY